MPKDIAGMLAERALVSFIKTLGWEWIPQHCGKSNHQTFPFAGAANAYEYLQSNEQFGKFVMQVN